MTRPLLLDLFCGAGGAAMGYHRAGFDIIGIDIDPQPHYPFEMWQGDALELAADLLEHWPGHVAAIHASPPCPRYSAATPTDRRDTHPDLLAPTRAFLASTGLPYVIENVPGSPMRPDVVLCGSGFGLPIWRHRLFELSGFAVLSPSCRHDLVPEPLGITGGMWATKRQTYERHRKASMVEARQILGLHPDTPLRGITNAIPAAYTEHIGRQLLAHLEVAA